MRLIRRCEGNEHHTVVEFVKLGGLWHFFAILTVSKIGQDRFAENTTRRLSFSPALVTHRPAYQSTGQGHRVQGGTDVRP